MFARKRFDIGTLDLIAGLVACASARDRRGSAARIESWFSPTGDALCCLSVRSGLDLYFGALALPRGSEVLMSALTIPDMWKIVERHGLVPIPVDVEAATLAPAPARLRERATPNTRIVLLAHLFGTRIPLEPVIELARERGWIVIEDCAQSFTGADSKGHPGVDVSLFSFGPIKTATALAGGVLCVRDRALLERMRARHATYALQGRAGYAKRILKYSLLKAVSSPWMYGGFVRLCALLGGDHDRVIQGSVRGFIGGDLFEKIRRQPSAPLLALLERRLEHADGRRIARRTHVAHRLLVHLPDAIEIPGAHAAVHSYWVFTILAGNREQLVARLRCAGFDATTAASLQVVPAPADRAELDAREARAMLARIVYLPVYPELPPHEIEALARIVRESLHETRVELAEDVGVTRLASTRP